MLHGDFSWRCMWMTSGKRPCVCPCICVLYLRWRFSRVLMRNKLTWSRRWGTEACWEVLRLSRMRPKLLHPCKSPTRTITHDERQVIRIHAWCGWIAGSSAWSLTCYPGTSERKKLQIRRFFEGVTCCSQKKCNKQACFWIAPCLHGCWAAMECVYNAPVGRCAVWTGFVCPLHSKKFGTCQTSAGAIRVPKLERPTDCDYCTAMRSGETLPNWCYVSLCICEQMVFFLPSEDVMHRSIFVWFCRHETKKIQFPIQKNYHA